jgi:hypothetical protein
MRVLCAFHAYFVRILACSMRVLCVFHAYFESIMRIYCAFFLFYAYVTRILSVLMRIPCVFHAYFVCFVCCPGDLNPIRIPDWRAAYNVSVVSHMSVSGVIVCLARGATQRGADERVGWGLAKDQGEGEKCDFKP